MVAENCGEVGSEARLCWRVAHSRSLTAPHIDHFYFRSSTPPAASIVRLHNLSTKAISYLVRDLCFHQSISIQEYAYSE
jgi:hypothetical protein